MQKNNDLYIKFTSVFLFDLKVAQTRTWVTFEDGCFGILRSEMLCYQFSQVWIDYEVSHFFTCLSTAYILLHLPKVQEVIATQRTTLALEMVVCAHRVKTINNICEKGQSTLRTTVNLFLCKFFSLLHKLKIYINACIFSHKVVHASRKTSRIIQYVKIKTTEIEASMVPEAKLEHCSTRR